MINIIIFTITNIIITTFLIGNYLAHTQGKRHQYNLGRRAAMEAKNAAPRPMIARKEEVKRSVIKIGRPGYKVSEPLSI